MVIQIYTFSRFNNPITKNTVRSYSRLHLLQNKKYKFFSSPVNIDHRQYIIKTIIKNRFKIRSKFHSDIGMIFEPFVINFGSILSILNLQTWYSHVGAVLCKRKSRYSYQVTFWIGIFMNFDGHRNHFVDYFGIKNASANRFKNQSKFSLSLDGFWLSFCAFFGPIVRITSTTN